MRRPTASVTASPARWRVVLAFAAIYVIWGTTYLAIRYGIETLPPFLMSSARFFIAGGLLFAWGRFRGVPIPRPTYWKPAILASVFLMVGGQGMVAWAESRIPSGLAAVLISIMPIWMLGLNWVRPGGQRPDRKMIVGLVVGFAGVVILIGPWQTGGRDVDLLGAAGVLFAAFSWAAGSLYTRSVRMPVPHLMVTAMQMLSGAVAGLHLRVREPGGSGFSRLAGGGRVVHSTDARGGGHHPGGRGAGNGRQRDRQARVDSAMARACRSGHRDR